MFQNKTVFITGASSGIGEAIAHRFGEAGARLVLSARRVERLDSFGERYGARVYAGGLDVRRRNEVEQFVTSLPAEFRQIDLLINNAGLSRGLEKVQDGNPDGWDEMIDTNVKGLLYVTRAILPSMVTRNSGHIINIGSIAGHELYPAGNVYCASKHAVDAITRGLLMDLVDTDIRVSTIDPGLVETEFSQVRFYGDTARAEKVYQGFTPLRAQDIAEAVFWVASRPSHVQIAQMTIFPTAQGGSMVVHRKQ